MRVVRRVAIDRKTGAVTCAGEVLPDATLRQRFEHQKATAPPGGGPVEARFASVVCDGCGAVAEVDYDDPQLPPGWVTREDGEFCPACR